MGAAKTTLCVCGHSRSQHHCREEGGPRVCDYAGHTCQCVGYSTPMQAMRKARLGLKSFPPSSSEYKKLLGEWADAFTMYHKQENR